MILEGINPQQKEAITYSDGPMLILAGAGSGKTRVITHKFAYLCRQASPNKILTMTFTNKAAAEMKDRIHSLTKKDLKNTWIGTFHSQCNRILRKEIPALGYRSDFTIYDDDDQHNLIRHILKEFKIHEALYRGFQSRISSLKAASIGPEEFLSNGEGFGFEERLARVYVRYQDELKRCNALDFDDLIMLTIKLFKENKEVLKKYQDMFNQILVDEFQDTNQAQYELIKLLAAPHNNVCVVGDDDQSIYAFRGANIKNILSFEKDFPKAKIIKLEQNYRSTQNILTVSDCVIKNNKARRDKTLWSDRGCGEQVCMCWLGNEKEEASYIAKLMREMYLKGMYDYSDFAVLFRTNLQSRAIEESLRRERIPYKVIGGTSFYHRKEIKDMAAYMRLAVNNDDNVCLRRIINVPARGIGASTLLKVEQQAKKSNTSLLGAIKAIIKAGSITAATKEKLESFVKIVDSLAAAKFNTAAEMLQAIYDVTGYSEGLEEARAENVVELISSGEGREIGEFLDSLSLVQIMDDSKDGAEKAVSLLTLHSAKGLEFPVVFLSGLEEGVLPYFKAKTPEEVDEERRLLYVGMTRAKDLLWLTGAGKRRMYSKVQDQEPSRFLANIPGENCKRIDKIVKENPAAASRRPVATAGKIKTMKPASPYSIGCRVRHPKWGVGIVRDSQGQGDALKIIVNFPTIGTKRLALKFANLERIR